ncbi:MAG: tetratricopeptide repeat protein [Chitinophagaceae bacterium]|nr:MAG: tetratricopeptide repeat protein [Chitinophagaceae bacterium]
MRYLLYIQILLMVACNDGEKAAPQTDSIAKKESELINLRDQYPDSAVITEELAQYYRDNGNYGSAIATINKALDRDSTNARLWDIKGILHIENGDSALSLKALERSVAIYPQPDVVISLGILYAQTKNASALAVADELIVADKAKAEKEALFIKGLYYSAIGDKNKALGFFDQCLSISYSFMEAYREKAITLYDLGKYKEAIVVLDKATTVQNNFDEGYYYKGRCYEKLKDVPKAIEAYQMALMYDPNYLEAKDALGKLGVTY